MRFDSAGRTLNAAIVDVRWSTLGMGFDVTGGPDKKYLRAAQFAPPLRPFEYLRFLALGEAPLRVKFNLRPLWND